MTDSSDRWQELDAVLDRVLDDIYDDEDVRRLNEILRADVEACRHYVRYVELHGRLAWGDAPRAEGNPAAGRRPSLQEERDHASASASFTPAVFPIASDLPTSFSPSGSFLFSYAVAALTVLISVVWMLGEAWEPARLTFPYLLMVGLPALTWFYETH